MKTQLITAAALACSLTLAAPASAQAPGGADSPRHGAGPETQVDRPLGHPGERPAGPRGDRAGGPRGERAGPQRGERAHGGRERGRAQRSRAEPHGKPGERKVCKRGRDERDSQARGELRDRRGERAHGRPEAQRRGQAHGRRGAEGRGRGARVGAHPRDRRAMRSR